MTGPMQARRLEPEHPGHPLLHLAIERIYRAAMGDVDWVDPLSALVRAHGAEGAMLFTPELAAESGGLSVSFDVNARSGLRAISSELDVPRSSTGRAFSAVLGDEEDETLPATLFLLFRSESALPLAEDEVAAIQLCCRHLTIAVRLWYRDRFSREGSETLAAAVTAAALIVDEDGRVTWMNRRAAAWMREHRLVIAGAHLVDAPGIPVDFKRVVRDVAQQRASPLLAIHESVTVEVMPVPAPRPERAPGKVRPAALVVLRDGYGGRATAAALAANFRLTATEVDLAIALWKGMLIAEYAAQRSVAMSTVRTQLKSLLAKTGSRRQSDIVSVVARLQPITEPDVMADSYYRDWSTRIKRDTSNG
jgi:DNA-binding CsgD family transcriptional regulator